MNGRDQGNIVYQKGLVTRQAREQAMRQRGCVVWFTGLSGAGKSTIAYQVEAMLVARGVVTLVLDGDNLRHGLCNDLGFSQAERSENIRRAAQVARLTMDAGLIVLVALISPMRTDRMHARTLISPERFVEVYVEAPLVECERRDTKGLYARARRGEIKEFTGLDAPYEPPSDPELTLPTAEWTVERAAEAVVHNLQQRGCIVKAQPGVGS